VLVREARADDLPALLALYDELTLASPPRGREAGAPGLRRLLDQILADPHRHLLVAELDGRLLGTADLLLVENLTHSARPWAIVENVVVTSAARGSGVGSLLMERSIEIARAGGCYKLQLLSRKERLDAHRFYEHLGFQPLAEGFRIYLDG